MRARASSRARAREREGGAARKVMGEGERDGEERRRERETCRSIVPARPSTSPRRAERGQPGWPSHRRGAVDAGRPSIRHARTRYRLRCAAPAASVQALSARSRACESTKRGQLNGSRTLRWQSRTTHARVRARGQGTYRREVVAVQILSARSRACESTKPGQLNGSRALRWHSRTQG